MSTQSTQSCLISSITRDECWIGAYVLHIRFTEYSRITVGRFNRGEPIALPLGRYLYVGSAMGSANGLYLPKRLLRHTRRSNSTPNHALHLHLVSHFIEQGINKQRLRSNSTKKLRWNIDYVLDSESAELESVAYIRSEKHLEYDIVDLLESNSTLTAPFAGFGAHDHPGHSHLLAAADAFDWSKLTAELSAQYGRN